MTILRAPSPLFRAAIATLGHDPDPLATLVRLRDAFPRASLGDIQATVREQAVLFLDAGIVPPEASNG